MDPVPAAWNGIAVDMSTVAKEQWSASKAKCSSAPWRVPGGIVQLNVPSPDPTENTRGYNNNW